MAKKYEKGYEGYVKKYREAEAKMRASGYPGMASPLMTPSQYRAAFEGMRNELMEKGQKTPNVIRAIINDQKYLYSQKQAKLFRTAAVKAGFKDAKIKDIQLDKIDVKAMLSRDYQRIKKEYLDQGYSQHAAVMAAKNDVEIMYFDHINGSP